MSSDGLTHGQYYGGEHQRARRYWAAEVESGGVSCWRCHAALLPGSEWDLGHVDDDPDGATRPECRPCNRATLRAGRATALRRARTIADRSPYQRAWIYEAEP